MDIETIRAEALRKLGRNIVNLSKLEAGFKHLLAASQVEGTAKTLPKQLRRNQIWLRKQTLGQLVQKFNEDIVGDANEVDPSTNFFGTGMSFSFKVSYGDPGFSKAQKRALLAVVAERNQLIHQDLAYLDTTSVEDYRKLIDLLDEQNPRLLAHLEDLKWIIASLGESLEDIQSFVESTEFLQHMQSSQSDT